MAKNTHKKNDYSDLFEDDQAQKPLNEFEQLLNQSTVIARGLSAGDRFRGEVLTVSGQEIFLSTGTPTDAILPLNSFSGDLPKVGDSLDVIVVRAREGEILVKKADSRGVGETDNLEDAYDMEIPVEGTVLEAIKGGFRVKVFEVKAFCPISQIDFNCTNPADYVGRKFEFIITKFDKGRDLVVSRRRLLELERASKEGEFLNSAEEGSVFSGQIFRIEKYGAFVRLENGIEGLIPISEMAWGRINHPQEVVNLEQVVQVKLIRITEEADRLKISFSLKQGGSTVDPWTTIESDYPVGSQVDGVVEHKEPFGLFVNIAMGVTGLLPKSSYRDSVESSSIENKRKGDRLRIRIERIDKTQRKLSFAIPKEEDDQTWRDHQSSQSSQKSFGTFADLMKGVKKS